MPAITTPIRDALTTSLTAHDVALAESFKRHRRSVLAVFRVLADNVFNPYRPERHYMRGPGPAWRKKHGSRPAA